MCLYRDGLFVVLIDGWYPVLDTLLGVFCEVFCGLCSNIHIKSV